MPADLEQIDAEFRRLVEERRLRISEIATHSEPHRTAERPTRADLHALLDACLDLEELHQERAGAATLGDAAAEAARPIATVLARGAFGWTEPPEPATWCHLSGMWMIIESLPNLWRQELAARLSRAPHVLPPRLLQHLLHALEQLDQGDGKAPFLLLPAEKVGRGQHPELARRCEETLWCWIFHQNGSGRRIADAVADVAKAVGRSTDAVEAWRRSWAKRDGVATVNEVLAKQKARGAAGEEFMARWDLAKIARLWVDARAKKGAAGRS